MCAPSWLVGVLAAGSVLLLLRSCGDTLATTSSCSYYSEEGGNNCGMCRLQEWGVHRGLTISNQSSKSQELELTITECRA